MAGQPYTLTGPHSATGAGQWRTNIAPWNQGTLVTESIARGGLIWQHRIWFDTEPSSTRIKIASRSRPVAEPNNWGAWAVDTAAASLNDGSIRNDGHLSATMGVDKFGVPHVAWCAHGDTRLWHYHCGDAAGDTHVDSNGRTSGSFGGFNVPDARGTDYNVFGGNFSYPDFFILPNGEFYFSGRIGPAGGNAQQQLWHWNTSAEAVGVWEQVGGDIIDWTAGGDEESPYMQSIAVNANGRIALSWCWARTNATLGYHDIYYIYSDDSGATWKDVTGGAVTLPASNQAALLAWSIPENNGLPVHHGMALRDNGQPIIACYYAGTPPATDVYVITRNAGAWVRHTVCRISETWNLIDADGGQDPDAPNSEYLQASQPGVIADEHTAHVYFRSNYLLGTSGLPVMVVCSAYGAYLTDWSEPVILVDEPLGDAQPRHDVNAWDYFRQASFSIQLLDESESFGDALFTPVYTADATLPEDPNMSTLSTALCTALANHFRDQEDFTPAATIYAHLKVNGSYFSGSSYAPASNTNNKTTWSDFASRAVTNDVAFTFPDATGVWFADTDDIEIELSDNATAGAGLIYGIHAPDMAAFPDGIDDTTGPLIVGIGEIDLAFPAGCLPDAEIHALGDLAFGGTANVARATVHGTYFAGDPQAGGTETSAARTSITQATTYGSAVNGLIKSILPVSLADEADATYYAEYSASSGGTLVFSAPLPASGTPPEGGIIPAGALRTRLF